MAYIPKYEKLKNQILQDIRSGRYPAGSRIPTREQLIEKYQVTRTTINHALKELVENGVLATSKRGGTTVTGRSPVRRLAYFSTLGEQIVAQELGKEESDRGDLLRPLLSKSAELELIFVDIEVLVNDPSAVDRYDFAAVSMPNDAIMGNLFQYRNKVIILNRYPEQMNFISTNHREAVREMTRLNLERAGKNAQIFFLAQPENFYVARERRDGFVDACAAGNAFYRIIEIKSLSYQDIYDTLMNIDFAPGRPIVMVSPTLGFTGAVLKMAGDRKLEFNRDIFYSDFDNGHSQRNTGIPLLSAVQNYREMGERLADVFLNGKSEGIREFVPYRLTD
jgi:DNA-binding transcriptional regulator YhcF (GntR family)